MDRLAVMEAPGAALHGASPEANFAETDGSVCIGKFLARDDDGAAGAP